MSKPRKQIVPDIIKEMTLSLGNNPATPIVAVSGRNCGGGGPLFWIAGPCVIQTADLTFSIAETLARVAEEQSLPLIFKASFDKANRSSGKSFRGLGIEEGLRVLEETRRRTGLPITTDVHESAQVPMVGAVVDVIQIPAFLARQTDLLVAAARTGKVVNVKKGQFMAPWDMKNVVAKLREEGNPRILLTERGTTFGYGNLVNDLRAIPWMQDLGCPVIFDATHSVQTPGSQGDRTGGDRRMVPFLARAAVAAGCDGIFIETHPRPEESPSDGPNMIPLSDFPELVRQCLRVRSAIQDLNAEPSAPVS